VSRHFVRFVRCLAFLVLIGSARTLNAAPLDSPDTVYIDGVPCNRLCQAYMAWSREILAAGSAQRAPGVVAPHPTEMSRARPQPAARKRFAKQTVPFSHEMRRHRSTAPTSTAAASPAATHLERPNADRTGGPNKQMETPNERQAKLPESPEAESASVNKAADSSPKQPDHPDDSKTDTPGTAQATSAPHPSNTELADVPRPGQSESSSRKPVTAPSLEETESTPNSSKSSVREQMIAAASMAEHLTEATSSVGTKPNAMERDGSMSLEGTDGDRTASTSPSTTDTLVALLVSRPEIKSMSDLSGKNVAIDNARSESQGNVRTALVAAGAPAVELSTGDSNAIDRLIGGEVPAAIVALVSPEAAEAFPDINGFRIFRVPLSARSAKSGTDVP
jgi:hypothetical protein